MSLAAVWNVVVEGRVVEEGGPDAIADIADAVKAQTGIDIDRKSIESDGIKTTGQHTVTASLHSDVSFPITLDVVPAE